MHPVNRRVTTQYLNTKSIATRRKCGLYGRHEARRDLASASLPIKWKVQCLGQQARGGLSRG